MALDAFRCARKFLSGKLIIDHEQPRLVSNAGITAC
jgi:hypothetical protein